MSILSIVQMLSLVEMYGQYYKQGVNILSIVQRLSLVEIYGQYTGSG